MLFSSAYIRYKLKKQIIDLPIHKKVTLIYGRAGRKLVLCVTQYRSQAWHIRPTAYAENRLQMTLNQNRCRKLNLQGLHSNKAKQCTTTEPPSGHCIEQHREKKHKHSAT